MINSNDVESHCCRSQHQLLSSRCRMIGLWMAAVPFGIERGNRSLHRTKQLIASDLLEIFNRL